MPRKSKTGKTRRAPRGKAKANAAGGQQLGNIAYAATNLSARSQHANMRFKHCERIGSVQGSNAFKNVLNFAINPGLPTSFPWLSGHASLFEKYKIHSLAFRYKNLKGSATDGNILMSIDYDTLDGPPADAVAVTQSTVYQDGAPWRVFTMKVPTYNTGYLYTRTSDDVGNADLKTYDFGRLWVSAEACADESIHGYVEVIYDISFTMKQPNSALTPPVLKRTRAVTYSVPSVASLASGDPLPLAGNGQDPAEIKEDQTTFFDSDTYEFDVLNQALYFKEPGTYSVDLQWQADASEQTNTLNLARLQWIEQTGNVTARIDLVDQIPFVNSATLDADPEIALLSSLVRVTPELLSSADKVGLGAKYLGQTFGIDIQAVAVRVIQVTSGYA